MSSPPSAGNHLQRDELMIFGFISFATDLTPLFMAKAAHDLGVAATEKEQAQSIPCN